MDNFDEYDKSSKCYQDILNAIWIEIGQCQRPGPQLCEMNKFGI